MAPKQARELIVCKYTGGYELIDCSDLENNPEFNSALLALHKTVGAKIYELLAAEFSRAVEIGDEYPLMYLEQRVAGTNLFPVVQYLLNDFHSQLSVVIEAIHRRADEIRHSMRVEDGW